jgi:hypothetical protein
VYTYSNWKENETHKEIIRHSEYNQMILSNHYNIKKEFKHE